MGVGLLGLSGKYGNISKTDQNKCFEYICNNFNFLDTSNVYGEAEPLNSNLGRIISKTNSDIKVINKIGAGIKGTNILQKYKNEFHNQLQIFNNVYPYALLIHQPNILNFEAECKFLKYIKNISGQTLIGICTNNLKVLENYIEVLDIDILQIAINPLDYLANTKILQTAKNNGLIIHARSALSSGIINGKYTSISDCKFSDPLRSRFLESEKNKDILSRRIKSVNKIKSFYKSSLHNKEIPNISFESFVYSLTYNSEFIDNVILGGSCLKHIKNNLFSLINFDKKYCKKVYNKHINEWSAPYL